MGDDGPFSLGVDDGFDLFGPAVDSSPEASTPLVATEPHGSDRDFAIWRCIRCDSSDYLWDFALQSWVCGRCEHQFFYDVRESCKRESTDGIGMYIPKKSGAETASASKTSSDPGSPPAPPPGGSEAGSREGAESEIATTDPLVDPDASVGRRRRRRRGASNAGLDPGDVNVQPRNEPNVEDKLVSAIKNAFKTNHSEMSWNSRKGPEKGVRFRGGTPPSPPLWKGSSADLRAFARWEKKVQVWMLQMKSYATEEDTALAFFTSLSGEAELEVEHLDLALVHAKNGVQYVLDALREPLQQKQLFQKRRLLNEFESVARNNGESIRGYINRYNRVVRDLEAIGITTTGMYDSESRGYRLLERSRLAPDLQRLVLIAAGNSLQYEKITDALLLQFPDFKQPPAVFYHGSNASAPSYHKSSKGSSKGSTSSGSSTSSFASSYQSSGKSFPLRGSTLANNQKGSFKLNRLEMNSCQQFRSRLMVIMWISKMGTSFKMLMRAVTLPKTMRNIKMKLVRSLMKMQSWTSPMC